MYEFEKVSPPPKKEKSVDWKSLNGKSLRIIVAQPNNVVIGINEETNESFVLHQDNSVLMRTLDIPAGPEPIIKRSWFGG